MADYVLDTSIVTIPLLIDGGGEVIGLGIRGKLPLDFPCIILSVVIVADQSGSIVVDIWKDTLTNYPPTVADTITASAKPTISSATYSEDTTLTGWTTTINADDVLLFNVDSITSIVSCTLKLKVKRV